MPQVVNAGEVVFPVLGSYSNFSNNRILGQLPGTEHLLEVVIDGVDLNPEQLGHPLLGQPEGFVLIPDFDAGLARWGGVEDDVRSDSGETLPNQLEKELQNSTLRWIFQIKEGMGMLHFYGGVENKMIQEMVTNMSPLRREIIQLFGPTACEMHGLNPERAF
jgi:hypothetical protein